MRKGSLFIMSIWDYMQGFSPQPETEGYRIYGGMILSMKDINSSGYFRGEVDYSEKKFTNDTEKLLNDGVYFFFGDIDYSLWKWPFDRNPFIKEQNRTYEGVLYFVDRLDIHLDTQDIYNFLQATYKVKYYRDYRAIELQLVKREERMKNPLPEKIFLYKDVKLNLSPYKDVKQIIFRDTHRRHNDA